MTTYSSRQSLNLIIPWSALHSRKYPHSEFMPLFASISLAREPNAFTKIDTTCFYFDAISEGALFRMVPVMLDHIFRPLLQERDFITEIYHVNGRGEEGGVMYAEMKVRTFILFSFPFSPSSFPPSLPISIQRRLLAVCFLGSGDAALRRDAQGLQEAPLPQQERRVRQEPLRRHPDHEEHHSGQGTGPKTEATWQE